MKGQFYVLGALVLIVILFAGIPLERPVLVQQSKDLDYLLTNIKQEFPRAVNLGRNQSTALSVLEHFTSFTTSRLAEKAITFNTFWMLVQNTSGSDVTIDIGNYLGTPLSVVLTFPSETQIIVVPANTTNETTYTVSSDPYNLTINFTIANKTVRWYEDKTNFYGYFRLQRGENIVVDDIEA
ncbi:MAG: hypothetical protein KKA90_01035 [Nanoarchaeota archaeon]|nr:hypothetical protein [Nanoarchaeota archaeon]